MDVPSSLSLFASSMGLWLKGSRFCTKHHILTNSGVSSLKGPTEALYIGRSSNSYFKGEVDEVCPRTVRFMISCAKGTFCSL